MKSEKKTLGISKLIWPPWYFKYIRHEREEESTSIYSKTSVVYQKHTQTETRRIVTDKKIDIKQKFTLTHQHTNTHYLAISTSVRCFIVAINTIENCKKKIATFMFLCKPNNYLSNVAKLSKIIHNSDTQTHNMNAQFH